MLPLAQSRTSFGVSITSTGLQKIAFPVWSGSEMVGDPAFATSHEAIDDSSHQLVDRLQRFWYERELGVAFRMWEVLGNEEIGSEKLLPNRWQGSDVEVWGVGSFMYFEARI